jgi:hypothetical protein
MSESKAYGHPGNRPTPVRKHSRGAARRFLAPHPGTTAVELRSADFSPLPLGARKHAGSGMNSVRQFRSNSLNSMAVHPDPVPEEREQRARHSGKPTRVDYSPIGEGFTLSRGERAGVRGNGAKSLLAYRTNPRIVEFGESSGTARGFPECL